MSGLTEEQKRRIEENKRKALEKLQAKKSLASRPIQNNNLVSTTSSKYTTPTAAASPKSYSPLKNKNRNYVANQNTLTNKLNSPSSSTATSSSSYSPLQKETASSSLQSINDHSKIHNGSSCVESQTPTKPSISFSPFKRQSNSSVRKNITNFYNQEQSLTEVQKERAYMNKCKAQEKFKQKMISSQTSNESVGTSYPRGYSSPPKENRKNTVEINLILAMKSAIWFKVEHNSRHQVAVGAIAKQIANKQYNASCGFWMFHIKDYQTVVNAFESGLNVSIDHIPENVVRILQDAHRDQNKCTDVDLTIIGSEILEKLMPFQREGILFGIKRKGRLLIADDMGLGKTVQAIALCAYYKDDWPVLVICPSSVKMSWQQHFLSWIPSLNENDINIVNSGKDDPTTGKVNITSYELASKFVGDIYRKKFKIIIADESHFLKNHAAARTKNIVPLLQVTKRAMLLSGTPALSRPRELFTQIKALEKNLFTHYHLFSTRYCDGKQTNFGWDDCGCSNYTELNAILLSTLMIRRMKADVLHQLPEKRRQIVVLDPSMIKNTRELKSEERTFLDATQDKRSALLNYFLKTADAKLKGVCEYISQKVESVNKIIVFAHHIMMLDAIEAMAVKKKVEYIRIDGSTNAKLRQNMIDKFNTDSTCLLAILSLTACGTGLNITGSSFVIFAELYWNPGHLQQAEDRAHRIGQKNCVSIVYLVAQKTADDYIWPMVQSKLKVLTNLGVGKEKGFEGKTTTQDCSRQTLMFEFFEQLIEDDDKELLEGLEKLQEEESNKDNGETRKNCESEVSGITDASEDSCEPVAKRSKVS